MAERTKDELIADARAAGVENADDLTKAELGEAIASHVPDELGPVIPEGQTVPPAPKSSGSPTVGVQPVDEHDIPEAGR